MDIRTFSLLKKFECMTDAKDMKIGDKFLTGGRINNQVEIKEEGASVTYYEVINVDSTGNNFEYVQRFDKLEATPEDNRRTM